MRAYFEGISMHITDTSKMYVYMTNKVILKPTKARMLVAPATAANWLLR